MKFDQAAHWSLSWYSQYHCSTQVTTVLLQHGRLFTLYSSRLMYFSLLETLLLFQAESPSSMILTICWLIICISETNWQKDATILCSLLNTLESFGFLKLLKYCLKSKSPISWCCRFVILRQDHIGNDHPDDSKGANWGGLVIGPAVALLVINQCRLLLSLATILASKTLYNTSALRQNATQSTMIQYSHFINNRKRPLKEINCVTYYFR